MSETNNDSDITPNLFENGLDEDQFADLMGFANFGKIRNKKKSYNRLIESSKTEICVQKRPQHVETKKLQTRVQTDSSSDSELESEKIVYDINKPEDRIPCSNMLNISNGSKLVSGISIDASGSRMLTVGHDFHLNMHDFATMDSKFKPFRSFDPLEDVPLRSIKHSPAGDLVMVYGGTSLIKLLDRDGKLNCACMRGDQYLVDMNQTKGHVSAVNSAAWNPIDLDCFVTCGMDSTIRIWSVEVSDGTCKRVIRVRTSKLKNNPCVEVLYNREGTLLYGACTDGCISIWDTRKSTPIPVETVSSAHQNGGPAYSMAISRNDYTLVSRGFDDTLKLWDLRKFKVAVKSLDLPNSFDTTRVAFSPDHKLIVTGTSERRGKENSFLNFYSVEDLSLCKSIPFGETSAIIPVWHPKLNQLFVGCSDGNIKVFFDPKRSMKGILMCMTKIHETKTDAGELLLQEQVFNPYSRQDGMEMMNVNVRKLQIKARRDPFLTRKPEPPVYGPGQGGRLTTAMSLSAFVCKQMLPIVPPTDESNPREAILQYAQLAEEEPYYVAPAYEKTQPVAIYGEVPPDENEKEDIIKKKKTS